MLRVRLQARNCRALSIAPYWVIAPHPIPGALRNGVKEEAKPG